MAEIIDHGEGLELAQDKNGCLVRIEGRKGWSSLLFAFHEEEVEGDALTPAQAQQVAEWFGEHEV